MTVNDCMGFYMDPISIQFLCILTYLFRLWAVQAVVICRQKPKNPYASWYLELVWWKICKETALFPSLLGMRQCHSLSHFKLLGTLYSSTRVMQQTSPDNSLSNTQLDANRRLLSFLSRASTCASRICSRGSQGSANCFCSDGGWELLELSVNRLPSARTIAAEQPL